LRFDKSDKSQLPKGAIEDHTDKLGKKSHVNKHEEILARVIAGDTLALAPNAALATNQAAPPTVNDIIFLRSTDVNMPIWFGRVVKIEDADDDSADEEEEEEETKEEEQPSATVAAAASSPQSSTVNGRARRDHTKSNAAIRQVASKEDLPERTKTKRKAKKQDGRSLKRQRTEFDSASRLKVHIEWWDVYKTSSQRAKEEKEEKSRKKKKQSEVGNYSDPAYSLTDLAMLDAAKAAFAEPQFAALPAAHVDRFKDVAFDVAPYDEHEEYLWYPESPLFILWAPRSSVLQPVAAAKSQLDGPFIHSTSTSFDAICARFPARRGRLATLEQSGGIRILLPTGSKNHISPPLPRLHPLLLHPHALQMVRQRWKTDISRNSPSHVATQRKHQKS
jgi:hypothetical protein